MRNKLVSSFQIFSLMIIFSLNVDISASETLVEKGNFCDNPRESVKKNVVNDTRILILAPHGFYYDPEQTREINFLNILPEISPENMCMIAPKDKLKKYPSSIIDCIDSIKISVVKKYNPPALALTLDAQSTEVDQEILKVKADGFDFHRIIFFHEYDVLRALYNDPSRQLTSEKISVYRDKGIMLEKMKLNEIPIPDFALIRNIYDIKKFVDKYITINGDKSFSPPLVIKPIFGVSSMNTHILKSEHELDKFFYEDSEQYFHDSSSIATMIAQTFIEGEMCHIDSLIGDKNILWSHPSAYINNPHDATLGHPVGDYTLSLENSHTKDLLEFNLKVLNTMPFINRIATHIENFITTDKKIVFCEIAARPGGQRISDTMKNASGFHIHEEMFRLQAGLETNPLKRQLSNLTAGIIFSLKSQLPTKQIDNSQIKYNDSVNIIEVAIKMLNVSSLVEKFCDTTNSCVIQVIGNDENSDRQLKSLVKYITKEVLNATMLNKFINTEDLTVGNSIDKIPPQESIQNISPPNSSEGISDDNEASNIDDTTTSLKELVIK